MLLRFNEMCTCARAWHALATRALWLMHGCNSARRSAQGLGRVGTRLGESQNSAVRVIDF